jgi:hypothetical protein
LTRNPAAAKGQRDVVATVILKFGDALEQAGRHGDAREQFTLAARIAGQQGRADVEAAARQRLAR